MRAERGAQAGPADSKIKQTIVPLDNLKYVPQSLPLGTTREVTRRGASCPGLRTSQVGPRRATPPIGTLHPGTKRRSLSSRFIAFALFPFPGLSAFAPPPPQSRRWRSKFRTVRGEEEGKEWQERQRAPTPHGGPGHLTRPDPAVFASLAWPVGAENV